MCGEWGEDRGVLKHRIKRINKRIDAMKIIAYAGNKPAKSIQSFATSFALVFFLAMKCKITAKVSMRPITLLAMINAYPQALLPAITIITDSKLQIL